MASLLSLIISIVVFLIGSLIGGLAINESFQRNNTTEFFFSLGGMAVSWLISYIFWNFSRNNQVNKHQVNVNVQ